MRDMFYLKYVLSNEIESNFSLASVKQIVVDDQNSPKQLSRIRFVFKDELQADDMELNFFRNQDLKRFIEKVEAVHQKEESFRKEMLFVWQSNTLARKARNHRKYTWFTRKNTQLSGTMNSGIKTMETIGEEPHGEKQVETKEVENPKEEKLRFFKGDK